MVYHQQEHQQEIAGIILYLLYSQCVRDLLNTCPYLTVVTQQCVAGATDSEIQICNED